MADVDITAVVEESTITEEVNASVNPSPNVMSIVEITESVGVHPDKQISVAEVVNLVEYLSSLPYTTISVVDTASIAENVAQKKGIAVVTGKNVIALQSIGEVNWNWMDNFPGNRAGVRIHAISVMAAGADTFILRDGSTTGPIWFQNISAGAENKVVQIGGMLLRPVMVASEQTLSAASRYAIIYEKP